MKISDLADPRDRDHCIRAQKFPSVHQLRALDDCNSRVVTDTPVTGFDKKTYQEFNGLQEANA